MGAAADYADYNRLVRHLLPRAVQVRWDEWEELARGQEGVVFVDRATRTRALKVLMVTVDPDTADVRTNEARFNMLFHVNRKAARIGVGPRVYRAGFAKLGRFLRTFVEYEYVPGPTLDRLGARDAPAALRALERTVRTMVRAGLVHQDLHGGNVVVREADGRPFVIDWSYGCLDVNKTAWAASHVMRKLRG